MKKMKWMLAAILTLCGVMTQISCSDDDNNSSSNNGNTNIEQQKQEEWEPCNKLTYISGLENEDSDLQEVIRDRFPNQTQSLSEAEVAFVSIRTALDNADALDDFYDRGGLVVMMRPTYEDFDALAVYMDEDDDSDEEEEYYWNDVDIDDDRFNELFSENDQMEEVFYAFNHDGKHYTMYEEKPFDGNYTDELTGLSEEEEQAIIAYHEQHPDEDENDTKEWLYDNDYDQNYNYFQARLDPFIDFIEEIDMQTRTQQARRTRAVNAGEGNSDDVALDVEDGYFFVKDMPISLNHKIEKDYAWNKSSTVTIKYWVSSAYMLSSNGRSKSGDYYMVKSEITPHIKPLWEVAAKPGGLFNWGRCRIYAYWFDNMEVEYELLDAQGNSIADKIQYYKHPIPDNENTETSYSNGFNWGLNGSVGMDGKDPQVNVGFNLEWTSESSYSLKSIEYERNTISTYPQFKYKANNVKLTDADYESESETNKNFPAITHTEFSTSTAWIWRVPANSNLGATDNSDTNFKLRVKVKPVFASWYHWRGASEYDSNKKTYNGYTGASDGWFSHTEDLPAPERTPWGVIALKNAASSYSVASIKIYKQSEFTAKGQNAPVYATIPSSYNMNEVARKAIPEGTYTITYQAIDPNQQNKLLGTWKCEEVEIEQGQNAADATTEVSTINATLIQ